MKVYRGMDKDLGMKLGDTVLVKSFISTSSDIEQARDFTDYKTDCCLFELYLDDNIPYINMALYNVSEKEILLPRNLLMTYVGTTMYSRAGESPVPVRIMKMSRPVEIMLDDVPSMRGGRQKRSHINRTRRRNKSTI